MAANNHLEIRVTCVKPDKASSTFTYTIQFTGLPDARVIDVKERLCQGPLTGCDICQIRLIFSGKELNNFDNLKDHDITHETTIYAVIQDSTLEETAVDSLQDFTDSPRKAQPSVITEKPVFYIYCRNPCKNVQKAKLRVRCSMCKEGGVVVQRDPSCLEDVLRLNQITGQCLINSCKNTHAEFYFKCTAHPSGVDDNVVLLPLVRTNTQEKLCMTCWTIRSPVLIFPCESLHTTCMECFRDYCQINLDARQFVLSKEIGYTLPCPDGCENSLIRDVHHFRLLGDEQYERYKSFGVTEYVLDDNGIFCPSPNCGAEIFPDQFYRRVECVVQGRQGCGLVFCRDCRDRYHYGPCDQAHPITHLAAAERTRQQVQQTNDTIRKTTKPCPKCRTPTERNGGCMHMTCTVSHCKLQWCWICEIVWNNDCMANHWFGLPLPPPV